MKLWPVTVLGAVPRYVQRPLREDPRRTEADYYAARYDGEIRSLDSQLERLLEELRGRGLLDRTLVALTSDHGEGLGEHDYYFEHGCFAYQHQVHVPLLLRIPGVAVGAIRSPVEMVDLAPTVLDYLGVQSPPELQGASLRPLIEQRASAPRWIYSHTPVGEYPHHYRSVRVGPWKYIVDDSGNEELYHLERDPGEARNLAASRTELAEILRERIAEPPWAGAAAASEQLGEEELDDDTLRSLRALGYVD